MKKITMLRKKSRKLRNLLIVILLGILGFGGFQYNKSTDRYIRERVVQIKTSKGGCTGVEIKAPSGKIYTLTAGHCAELLINGQAFAIDESGMEYVIHELKIDQSVDLMLMSAIGKKSIDIADSVELHQHIRTLTHGGLLPIYRTDGEILDIERVDVMKFIIDEDHPRTECPITPWEHIVEVFFGDACIMTLNSQFTTAAILPGSSGGPAVDDAGMLVGIASNTAGGFISGFVPLRDIHEFLENE